MAAFDETIADYQETILRSLQDVEDSLSTLRILREEADVQASAVAAAERSVAQATNRYRGGVATYLEVIAAQNAALTNERTELSVLSRRLAASVLLIKALGGGWDVSTLPIIKTGTR
jgi:outer membrane protein TolC